MSISLKQFHCFLWTGQQDVSFYLGGVIKCKVGIGQCSLQGSFFSQFGAENSKRHGVYLQKKRSTFGDLQFQLIWPKCPFRRIFYIFINTGLEPKIFVFKSSTQQQSCRAHKMGPFCHQGWPSICIWSKVRDRAMTAFQLAPKWSKVAKGGFGSCQQYLTHRKLD